jgi:hypothetical protein
MQNQDTGAKAEHQNQQPPKSGPMQSKVLVELDREAGRLTVTTKWINFTEVEMPEKKTANKEVHTAGDPGVPVTSAPGRSNNTESDPAAMTDNGPRAVTTSYKKYAAGGHEFPPLPRGVARCFVNGVAVKRKRAATASGDCPKKRTAATKKAVRRLVKD